MKTMHADHAVLYFIYELQEWLRLLGFMKQQNVFYKSTLADIVSNVEDDEVLSMAEEFNEEFISHDRMIDFLSAELKNQSRLLEKDIYENNGLFRQIMAYQKKLRNDICKAEELIVLTKKKYCQFITDVL